MQERDLKTFLTVAQLGSFSRAATVLYVTQSTVTSRIRGLEEQLGHALFSREARGVTLTEAGRVFLRYAQRSLQSLEDGQAAVRGLLTTHHGQVRMAACHVPVTYDLPTLFSSAAGAKLWPYVELQITSSKKVFRALLHEEADIGLVNVRFRHPELDTQIVSEYDMTVVSAPDSAIDRPIFFFEEELEDALMAHSVCHQLGLSESDLAGLGDMCALLNLVQEGLGVGILPRPAVAPSLQNGSMRELPGDEQLLLPTQIICLIVRKSLPTSSRRLVADRLTVLIRQYYEVHHKVANNTTL